MRVRMNRRAAFAILESASPADGFASVALDVTCSSDQGPLPAPRTWGYTASAGQVTLLIPQGGGLRVDAFRLQ